MRLELLESLNSLAGSWENAEDVEADLLDILAGRSSCYVLFKTRRGRGCKSRFVSFLLILKRFRRSESFLWSVSTYSLGQWTALADGNLVTLLNTESWGDVGSEVLVALLVTGVLWDEVKVLATDDESAVHLGGDDGSGQDTSTDGDLAGEWALLV